MQRSSAFRWSSAILGGLAALVFITAISAYVLYGLLEHWLDVRRIFRSNFVDAGLVTLPFVIGLWAGWHTLRSRLLDKGEPLRSFQLHEPELHLYPEGQCQSCGYSLIGNQSGVCPECGTVIDEPE